MYVIAVSNEKGGVAKTTTVASLAAALVEQGKTVLAVDLDSQANLSLALNIEPQKARGSIADVLLESQKLDQLIVETGIVGLNLIPANSKMSNVERFLPIQRDYEFSLQHSLTQISQDYQFVLLDCPPQLGVVTLAALVAANLLIIPTQAEFFSVYGLRTLMGWVRRIRAQYNPQLTYRLLITLYDRRNKIHRILSNQLRATFSAGLMETVIETDTKLREAPIAGMPILYHAPKSRAAMQYRALAQEIMTHVQEKIVQPT